MDRSSQSFLRMVCHAYDLICNHKQICCRLRYSALFSLCLVCFKSQLRRLRIHTARNFAQKIVTSPAYSRSTLSGSLTGVPHRYHTILISLDRNSLIILLSIQYFLLSCTTSSFNYLMLRRDLLLVMSSFTKRFPKFPVDNLYSFSVHIFWPFPSITVCSVC